MINAAPVEAFDEPPHYRELPEPTAAEGQEVVEVLAVGLHLVTRGSASGTHYTSPDALPFVPGIDAVVRRADRTLAYVINPEGGMLAERIVIDPATAIPVPSDADPATVAATMNPAMSSWMALHERITFTEGQEVLILGATGNAGATAVAICRHLGAGRIVAAGRDQSRLDELASAGADVTVALTDDTAATTEALADAAADVDVVLDYLWGPPTELAMGAVLRARTDASHVLDWVEIGNIGGPTISLPGPALRSRAMRLCGSGFGAIERQAFYRELPALVDLIASGVLAVRPNPVALRDIEVAWTTPDPRGTRTVIIP